MSHLDSRPDGPASRAFTLIELLVVISIIALLIAILLPSLTAARATATAVACQSNQRQIGILGATYATDFNGLYAPGVMYPNGKGNFGQYDPDWNDGEVKNGWSHNWGFTIMWPYLAQYGDSNDMFVCPRNDDIRGVGNITAEQPQGTQYGWWHGYSFNGYLHGKDELTPGVYSDPDRLEQPSAVMFVSENTRFETLYVNYIAGGTNAPFAGMFAGGLPGEGGRPSFLHTSYGDADNFRNMVNAGNPNAIDLARERHPGHSVNLLHYDGHSASRNVYDIIDITDSSPITWMPPEWGGGNYWPQDSVPTATMRLIGALDAQNARVISFTP